MEQTKLKTEDYSGFAKASSLDATVGEVFVYDSVAEQISERFVDKKTKQPQTFYNVLGTQLVDGKKELFSMTFSSKKLAMLLRENHANLAGRTIRITGRGESVNRNYDVEIVE